MSRPEPRRVSPATAKGYAAVAERGRDAAEGGPDEFLAWLEEHDGACSRAFAELIDAEVTSDLPRALDDDERIGYRGRGWDD